MDTVTGIFVVGMSGALLGLALLVWLAVRSRESYGPPPLDPEPYGTQHPERLDTRWITDPFGGCVEHAACVRTFDFEGRMMDHRATEAVVPPL